MGDEPHQQWTHLFAAVLREHSVVGVRAVLEWHLGRTPTRSEGTAAHRAARTMAGDGRVTLHQVTVPGNADDRTRRYVLVGRGDLPPTEWPRQATLQAVALEYPPPIPKPSAAFEAMLTALYSAAGRIEESEMTSVSPDLARVVAEAMEAPLAKLTRVRRQLRRQTH